MKRSARVANMIAMMTALNPSLNLLGERSLRRDRRLMLAAMGPQERARHKNKYGLNSEQVIIMESMTPKEKNKFLKELGVK